MKKSISGLTIALLFVGTLQLFRCVLPNPADPSKTAITAVFKNAESAIFATSVIDTVGRPLSIGAALYLPENFDSISLIVKENDVVTFDTMFREFNDDYFRDTVWCTRTFTSEGNKNVTLTPFSNPTLQQLSTNIPIFAKPVVSTVYLTFVKNNAAASGSMPVQTYTSGKTIKLPENAFVNSGYRFAGWAISASGAIQYKNSDEITLGTEDLVLFAVWEYQNSIKPAVVHAPSQLIAGKADTLLFAVDNGSRPDPLTISLLTNPPLDPAVFSIVPSGADSIRIAIAKSAGPTAAIIGIVTSNGTKSDTSRYTITLVSSEMVLWNATSVDQYAVEGSPFKLDLSQYLSAANSTGVSLSTDIGTLDKTTWNYTPNWGCALKIPAIITANKGDVSLALNINLNIASGDTAKPRLTLVDPSLDGKKVSSSQITVECKATDVGAGVDSVVFSYGTKKIPGAVQGDDIYSGVITGLVHNTPTQITVSASDKSRQKNSTTINFTVIHDSTMLDAEPPAIIKISGPENGSRIMNAKGSLTFTVNDNTGLDSVWWTLNGAFVAVVAPSSEGKFTISYTLSDYGINVIKVLAKDKSSVGNKGSQTVTLNYNTEPAAITLTAPADDATDVSTSPTFKWSGGEDADGDVVSFSVNYGTSQSSLSNAATVNGKTATISSPLAYGKTYFWQVTANSSSTTYSDKVQSANNSFTTEGSLPVISGQPKSQTVNEDQSVTFSVSATGFGTITYQWQENETNINGQTGASLTISTVTTAMGGKKYTCIVKNEVGEVISNAAILTVSELPRYKLVYNDNYATAHNAPIEETYKKGEKATIKVPPSTMTRTGCNPCTEWCLNWNCGTTYKGGETETMISDVTLSAHWEVVVVFVNGTLQSTFNTDVGTALGSSFPANPPDGTTQRFDGWYNGTTKITNATKFESGITVTAKWINRYKLTYDLNGGIGTSVPGPTYYDANSTVNVISSTGINKSGFSFNGWKNNLGSTVSGSFTIYSDVTLVAQWQENTPPQCEIIPSIATVNIPACYGEQLTVQLSCSNGNAQFTFDWWYDMMGTVASIQNGDGWSGQGTNKCTPRNWPGMAVWCIVKDQYGRTFESGKWTVNPCEGQNP